MHVNFSVLIHLLDLADSIEEQNLENINTSTFRQSREIDPASRAHDPGLGNFFNKEVKDPAML